VAKRLFDVAVSAAALVVFAPLMAIIAVWIVLDSPGGVLYHGVRAGRGSKPFRILKFRTMVPDAESVGGPTTGHGDRRITQSGRFLRRFKLDELPQLINVLKGEMSIVGPRPQVLSYTDKYNDEFRDILSVRPGITDWASIWNADEAAVLAGAQDADRAYDILINPTKLRLQLQYVRTWSVVTDLRIIYYTLRRMIDHDFYPPELAGTPRLATGAGASVSITPRVSDPSSLRSSG
jgi:lipopolysaccharide/colanic/teichoic acid biosynthesis glycosyltransferase